MASPWCLVRTLQIWIASANAGRLFLLLWTVATFRLIGLILFGCTIGFKMNNLDIFQAMGEPQMTEKASESKGQMGKEIDGAQKYKDKSRCLLYLNVHHP